MTQRIDEQVLVISPVEPEAHFIKIRGKMLCAEFVPRSHNAPLEKRESVFNRVRMNITGNIFARAVVHRFVNVRPDVRFTHCGGIRHEIVRNEDFDFFPDVFFDVLCERPGFDIACLKETKLTAALTDADNDFLVFRAPPAFSPMLATNVGFVHFDGAFEFFRFCFFHCRADAMTEKPRGFVSDAEQSLDLICRHSLARFAKQKHSEKPLFKWQVCVLKYRADGYGKLIQALRAFVSFVFQEVRNCFALALRTFDAVRPAEPFQQFAAFFIACILAVQFSEIHKHTSEVIYV